MFRQVIRPSLSPVSRSCPPRAQHAAARAHHTHSSKRPPRPPSKSLCLRIPIQSSTAFLQLGQSCQPCQSRRHPSYVSSRSFHSTPSVQGSPILIGLLAALKVSPQLFRCARVDSRVCLPRIFSRPQYSRSSAQPVALRLRSFPFSW
jgi:hypothetical protein